MILQSIWFFLWGLLWVVFFITDGFDFGIGTLYPFFAKNDDEKRVMINAMGPLWNGNEVWLITAGGVTFAAFPLVYSVMFSSLYSALMLILFALILRGVSFEFRRKINDSRWRLIWDFCIFIGSFLPALLFGVAFANIFQGLPIDKDGIYHGTLFTLLNPYGILGGVLFVVMFLVHGALWLAVKTEGELLKRAHSVALMAWVAMLVGIVMFLFASLFATPLFDNYLAHPVLFIVPLAAIVAFFGIRRYLGRENYFKAWLSSAAAIAGIIFFGFIGLYPNLFPSSMDKAYSLTALNASASPMTLKIMLIVVILFVPVAIAYQVWAYRLFSGKVTVEDLDEEEAY